MKYLVTVNSTVCKFKLKSPISYIALVLFRKTRKYCSSSTLFFYGYQLFEFITVRTIPEY